MDYQFLFRGVKLPGHTVINNHRVVTALRKQYDDNDIVPVALTIQLTHFKDHIDPYWLSCAEVDHIEGDRVIYDDIIGEYKMPCSVDQDGNHYLLYEGLIYVIDLSRPMELYFEAHTPELTVKVLKTGDELRADRGAGRRLHSLCPEAVRLHSFRYI